MAHVEIARAGAMGDPIVYPPRIRVATAGVVGAPWGEDVPPPPAKVALARLGVVGAPWGEDPDPPDPTSAAIALSSLGVVGTPWGDDEPPPDPTSAVVELASLGVLATPWAPAPDVEAAVYLLDLDGVWQPAQMIPL